MAEIIAPNLPTNCASLTAITERNAEHVDIGETADPFTDVPGDGSYDVPYLGMNRAGGSNPGVGICTGLIYQTAAELAAGELFSGWTELDQDEVARIPQDSQLIGGIAEAETAVANEPNPPFPVVTVPVTITTGADINNTANFVIADTAAADGAEMDTVSGAINNTGGTVAIGDLIWGQVPVA